MRWVRRTLLVLFALALVGAAAWLFAGPVTVEVARPVRGLAVEAVYGSGTVEPSVMLPIAFKVAGRLLHLHVDEGSEVREGQVLAELDSRELAASVAEWEARVRFSEAQFRRAADLFKSRIGTEAALDQARNEFDTARAALERARRQLGEMRLVAPVDGLIIRRDGEIGQLLQSGATIFWMSCCAGLRVTAEIDEEDISRVKPGQKALIRSDAFPDRVFEARVAEITPKGDPITRSFRVRISLPDHTPLLIGMTADVNIVVSERPDALLLPFGAIDDGRVWVVEDSTLSSHEVVLGPGGERMVEVRSGLSADALVVVDPGKGLREGRRVRIGSARPN